MFRLLKRLAALEARVEELESNNYVLVKKAFPEPMTTYRMGKVYAKVSLHEVVSVLKTRANLEVLHEEGEILSTRFTQESYEER